MSGIISMNELVAVLHTIRPDLSVEKRTQADIATVLNRVGIPFEREKRLTASDIPDFLVDGRLVIEVKLKGAQKMAVYHQLMRYAEHECVQGLILASSLSMTLPPEINGKPAVMIGLGRAWL